MGAADAALVAFVASGFVLLLRWRLIGEAPVALQGIGVAIAGLLVVPAVPTGGPTPGYVAALQVTAVAAVVMLCVASLGVSPVRAGLRPTVVAAWAVGLALVLALPLMVAVVEARQAPPAMAAIRGLEALACLAVAVALLVHGIRVGHVVFVATGAALVAVAAAAASLTAWWLLGGRVPVEGPSFFLAVGAAQLLLLVAGEMRSTLGDVVLRDIRGRRRWTAAEGEIERLRRVARGGRHDLSSMLSAVDGSLMVLSRRRSELTPEGSDRLIEAVRAQVQQLMAMLAAAGAPAGRYDLSELLRGVAAVHAAELPGLCLSVAPDLAVEGHADRVSRAVHNLLANVALHAPGAEVTLSARRRPVPGEAAVAIEEAVEITVADTGPGLADADLEGACEPGWRADRARGLPGSGLGLFQSRQLAEAEGGELVLGHSRPLAAPGARGLTATLVLPVRPLLPASSILPMRVAPIDATPEPAVPGRADHREGVRAADGVGVVSAEDRHAL